jgi:hypothetical protein
MVKWRQKSECGLKEECVFSVIHGRIAPISDWIAIGPGFHIEPTVWIIKTVLGWNSFGSPIKELD